MMGKRWSRFRGDFDNSEILALVILYAADFVIVAVGAWLMFKYGK
jgi:hypothetical protein